MSNSNAPASPQTPQGAPSPSSAAPAGATPNATPQGVNPTPVAPTPEAPRGLKGSGLRYTAEDGVPSWAVGKTADEVLRVSQDMYAALQRGGVSQPAAPQRAPVAPTPAPSAGVGVNPNLMYSDAPAYTEAILAEAERRAEARLAAAAPAFVTPLASMARQHAQAHRPDVWSAYGPEIEATAAGIDPQTLGNVQTWHKIVDYIASQHVDEIAHRMARDIVARGADSGMLPSGGGIVPNGIASMSPIRKLFADNHPAVAGYKQDGLTADAVIAQATRMGHDEDKYANMLTRRAAAVGGR